MFSKRQFLAGGAAAMTVTGLTPGLAWAGEPVAVPMHFGDDGRPYITATFNGHGPYRLILATGSLLNVLHWDLAEASGLKPTGGLWQALFGNQTGGTSGPQDEKLYRAAEVVFEGGYRLTEVEVSGSPPPREPAPDDKRRDGLVGTKLITSAPCRLDYVGNQIVFYPGGGLPLDGMQRVDSSEWMASDYMFDQVDVMAQFDGTDLTCILDTAGRTDLYLSAQTVARWGGFAAMAPGSYVEKPFDTDRPERGVVRNVRRKGFSLAGAAFDEINVTLCGPDVDDGLKDFGIVAVIGNGVMRQFDIAFDGKDGVFMKPNANFKPVTDPITAD